MAKASTTFLHAKLRVAVFMLTLLLSVTTFAFGEKKCGSADRMIVALHFAQVLYSELKEKEFGISLSHGTGTFVDSVTEADDLAIRFDYQDLWHPPDTTTDQYYANEIEEIRSSGIELPLYLRFSFIQVHPPVSARHLECRPTSFTSDVGYQQLKKVQSAIDPHPEWSDEEELRVARKLGLRYGPEDKSSLLQKLPLKELAHFYGKLRVESATFSMNAGVKCAGCSFVAPSWQITVSGSGGTSGLLIIIEPFFGKIVSISE